MAQLKFSYIAGKSVNLYKQYGNLFMLTYIYPVTQQFYYWAYIFNRNVNIFYTKTYVTIFIPALLIIAQLEGSQVFIFSEIDN